MTCDNIEIKKNIYIARREITLIRLYVMETGLMPLVYELNPWYQHKRGWWITFDFFPPFFAPKVATIAGKHDCVFIQYLLGGKCVRNKWKCSVCSSGKYKREKGGKKENSILRIPKFLFYDYMPLLLFYRIYLYTHTIHLDIYRCVCVRELAHTWIIGFHD